MTPSDSNEVRVRFAPSPTGYLHIGSARSALFNWLVARKAGGKFVLRIEDTDRSRHVEDSVSKILDDLKWLGLTCDEGPQAGGEFGPYFQSERLDIYEQYLQQLLDVGDAYYALESAEELAALRQTAQDAKSGYRYARPSPLPTVEQGRAARDAGQPAVVRFKIPDEDIVIHDEILGEVTLAADQFEDFVIQKSDGFPTYHFACVVDDELMKITHVLRGQEHLANTPKHVAMQRALGFATPKYAHLTVVFNMDGSKMSKRDKEKAAARGETPPEIDVHDFRVAGYLPEAIINFISLLGWSVSGDREQIGLDETVELFTIERIGKTNARFDRQKLLSFNTDWVARVSPDRLLEAFKDFAALNPDVPTEMRQADDPLLARVLAACEGFRTFPDVVRKAGFLFVADDAIVYDPKAVKKVLAKNEGAGYAMLDFLLGKLEDHHDWTTDALHDLIHAVAAEKETKLGNVAQPIRVAVTGTTVSPGIEETLILLGRDRTLARIRRCLAQKI